MTRGILRFISRWHMDSPPGLHTSLLAHHLLVKVPSVGREERIKLLFCLCCINSRSASHSAHSPSSGGIPINWYPEEGSSQRERAESVWNSFGNATLSFAVVPRNPNEENNRRISPFLLPLWLCNSINPLLHLSSFAGFFFKGPIPGTTVGGSSADPVDLFVLVVEGNRLTAQEDFLTSFT